jgi:hypothetical protein
VRHYFSTVTTVTRVHSLQTSGVRVRYFLGSLEVIFWKHRAGVWTTRYGSSSLNADTHLATGSLLQLDLGNESLREVSRAVVQLFGMSAPFMKVTYLSPPFGTALAAPAQRVSLSLNLVVTMKVERTTWELYFLHVIAACQRCEGSSLNDLIDTLLGTLRTHSAGSELTLAPGQILPLQSDWAADMFPALLDSLMQKNPTVPLQHSAPCVDLA